MPHESSRRPDSPGGSSPSHRRHAPHSPRTSLSSSSFSERRETIVRDLQIIELLTQMQSDGTWYAGIHARGAHPIHRGSYGWPNAVAAQLEAWRLSEAYFAERRAHNELEYGPQE